MADSEKKILHTRCSIPGVPHHVFLVAVDEFNFRNVVSSRVVEKLHLPIANGQATIKFSIGKYEDEVLCDIAPMETCHMLLGRLWLYNKIINPKRPSISFVHGGRRIKLIGLSFDAVHDDQLKLKEKIEKERRETEEKEREEKRRKELEKEREKMSKKILNSNVNFSLDCDVILQEQEDVTYNEAHHKLPCLRKEYADIIPRAPLYIQPTFRSQTHEDNEEKHMESFDFEFEFHLFDKVILQVCLTRRIALDHGVWIWKSKRKTSLMHKEGTTKSEFLQVVFDSGGWVCSSQFQVNKPKIRGRIFSKKEGMMRIHSDLEELLAEL